MEPNNPQFVDALVELIRSGVRPDVLEAQRVLLQRLSTQGDVFPSRLPAPLNITEVGGYLNLLERAGYSDLRTSAITSAIGIAGPAIGGEALAGVVPVGFVQVANDRPAGPAQPSIPPLLSVRADFHAPLMAALDSLRALGCALPLRAPRAVLPASMPGATAAALDDTQVMAALGRTMDVFPGTVLVDPSVDAVAIARPSSPPSEPFRLVLRELDGGALVPEASWESMRASSTTAVTDAAVLSRFVEVAPVLAAAGWEQPQPVVLPTSRTARGTLVQFGNTTGLVSGETTLGDELSLLYTPVAVARSALANFAAAVWDGTRFVPPS